MAQRVVQERGISVRLACETFGISQTCYRYEGKHTAENDEISDWLLRLTDKLRASVAGHQQSGTGARPLA